MLQFSYLCSYKYFLCCLARRVCCIQAGNRKHKIARHKSLAVRAKVRGPERGVDVIKTQSDLRAERREQLSEGNIWKGIQDAHQRLTAEDVSVSNLLGTGLLLGLTFGTAFQPTHNNGYLPVSTQCSGRRLHAAWPKLRPGSKQIFVAGPAVTAGMSLLTVLISVAS